MGVEGVRLKNFLISEGEKTWPPINGKNATCQGEDLRLYLKGAAHLAKHADAGISGLG